MTQTEQDLNALAIKLFNEHRRDFRPLYPWVFVRVLPKEQKVGLIHTPATQNKTMHEGIVLRTWEAFTEAKKYGHHFKESSLTPGDHVLFPHWCGQPINGFRPDLYRVVKECDWAIDKEGGIVAKVQHTQTAKQQLVEALAYHAHEWHKITEEELADVLLKRFLLVDKEKTSTTLSGV